MGHIQDIFYNRQRIIGVLDLTKGISLLCTAVVLSWGFHSPAVAAIDWEKTELWKKLEKGQHVTVWVVGSSRCICFRDGGECGNRSIAKELQSQLDAQFPKLATVNIDADVWRGFDAQIAAQNAAIDKVPDAVVIEEMISYAGGATDAERALKCKAAYQSLLTNAATHPEVEIIWWNLYPLCAHGTPTNPWSASDYPRYQPQANSYAYEVAAQFGIHYVNTYDDFKLIRVSDNTGECPQPYSQLVHDGSHTPYWVLRQITVNRLMNTLQGNHTVPDVSAPTAAPKSVFAQGIGEHAIRITWDPIPTNSEPEGVHGYLLRRDNVVIGCSWTQDSLSYVDSFTLSANTKYSYTVAAVNWSDAVGPFSASASALTLRDATPPSLLDVSCRGTVNYVTVVFSEPVDSTTASDPRNYKLSDNSVVQAAVYGPNVWLGRNSKTVRLRVQKLDESKAISVGVSNVMDLAETPNTIIAGSKQNIVFWKKASGLEYQKWPKGNYNLGWNRLADMDTATEIPEVGVADSLGVVKNVNFGAWRFSGLLSIPTQGTWKFYCVGNNGGFSFSVADWIIRRGNDPLPANITADAGLHPFDLVFSYDPYNYEPPTVEYEGPGVTRTKIPFATCYRPIAPVPSGEFDGTITSPLAGQVWRIGQRMLVSWSFPSQCFLSLTQEISVNNGLSWEAMLDEAISSDSGRFFYTIPETINGRSSLSDSARIRMKVYTGDIFQFTDQFRIISSSSPTITTSARPQSGTSVRFIDSRTVSIEGGDRKAALLIVIAPSGRIICRSRIVIPGTYHLTTSALAAGLYRVVVRAGGGAVAGSHVLLKGKP